MVESERRDRLKAGFDALPELWSRRPEAAEVRRRYDDVPALWPPLPGRRAGTRRAVDSMTFG